MKKALLICALALTILGGFHLIPSSRLGGEPADSPLFAQSLGDSKDNLSNPKNPIAGTDGNGEGAGNLITCEITCGPTCNQTTCGVTCVATCASTCTQTCSQITCSSTCAATCAATCAVTCSQPTCESTCVITCSYTCASAQITLVSFSGQAETDRVILTWITASEIDNYYFLVRRATDPEGEFSIIAQVSGNSSSTTTQHYSVTDFDVIPGVTYYYTLADISLSGAEVIHPVIVSATPQAAADFHLTQNYPNPFNQNTRVHFSLPYAAQMKLMVYNVQGKMVKILMDAWKPAGPGEAIWDGTDLRGYAVPSGTYFYQLNAGDLSAMGKMVLLR